MRGAQKTHGPSGWLAGWFLGPRSLPFVFPSLLL